MNASRPVRHVVVIMRRQPVEGPMSRWQAWRWVLDAVLDNDPAWGTAPTRLPDEGLVQRWLHPGFDVELFRDDAEGYYLNVTTVAPCWFVMYRIEQQAVWPDEPMPLPYKVSLSYHDAGRWLDAQDLVEQVPAPPDAVAWLQAFVDAHHVIEPKRRQRPQSFRSLTDRFGSPASISTEKKRGGGHG
ncbi:MAG: DUF3305 domain-containing protein [Burkholderiaceae bacterium]